VKPQAPPDLLEEMFEIQETLAEAKARGLDEAARKTLAAQHERLLSRSREEEARLSGPLTAAWDGARPEDRTRLLGQLKQGLATRAYLRTVTDDLSQALDEGEES
jgi:hypothetical protein